MEARVTHRSRVIVNCKRDLRACTGAAGSTTSGTGATTTLRTCLAIGRRRRRGSTTRVGLFGAGTPHARVVAVRCAPVPMAWLHPPVGGRGGQLGV